MAEEKRIKKENTERLAVPCTERLSVLLAWTFLLLLATGCGRERERPNILLITLDTTRPDHLSCYGYKQKTSPNLDALAAEGTLYENCLSVTSWTLPSHASLFTGLYPCTHRAHYSENAQLTLGTAIGDSAFTRQFHTDGLGNDAETLAETLSLAGYATAAVCGGPWLKAAFGLSQGFGTYDCDVDSVEGRTAGEITNRAISIVREHVGHQGESPLFLFLNYFDPHFPYTPPGRFRHAFSPPGLEKAAAYDAALKLRYRHSQYDGEILYMDEYIGMLFGELKRHGMWDNTWVIVTADHGEHFGERGFAGHGYALFEEALHVPLIIKPPAGWKTIGDRTARVQLVHIMPTILDRLGIANDAPFDVLPMDRLPMDRADGLAATELYRNAGNINTREDGERFDRDLTAIYKGRYKMIFSTREGDRDAGLFDLVGDPGETTALEGIDTERADEMRDALGRWRRALGDPLNPLTIEGVDEDTRKQLEALGY
jgi:arylsulfatase A-like enzyme